MSNANIVRKKSNRRKSVISVELEKFKAKIPISKETKKQLVRQITASLGISELPQVLFVKMFLILGLPWILESLHQLVDGNHVHLDEEGTTTRDSKCENSFREVFFRIASCFNMLRGVLLFLIFPCKASIWRKLVARFGVTWWSRQDPDPTNPTIETRLTRDSMDLKTFRGPSRGEKDDNKVVLTRFASLNNNAPAEGVRRLSLGEGKGSLDKSSSLRRQLLAPPVKPRDTKSLNM